MKYINTLKAFNERHENIDFEFDKDNDNYNYKYDDGFIYCNVNRFALFGKRKVSAYSYILFL